MSKAVAAPVPGTKRPGAATVGGDARGRVHRHFIDVAGRAVHGRSMGSGPPALFIHSSPANSSFLINDMAAVADAWTCFAFDTPGFGFSDPLPGDPLTVAEVADALADTLAQIDMPPCPVFGTHTGAAIAIELAARHPARVTGLFIDGLACFTEAESVELLDGYFQKVPLDPLGGHYSATWTRIRDQAIWFPWFARDPRALNENDMISPESTNRWVTMYFDAAETYVPAYRAAMTYRAGAEQAARLPVPAVFTASESDMLYPHLDRLALHHPRHRIAQIGTSLDRRRALMREAFGGFGSVGRAPALPATLVSSDRVRRVFVECGGRQMMLRTRGDRSHPPLLVLHDVPGAGGGVEARMVVLAKHRFVIAPDLPGCGESDALNQPTLGDFADVVLGACTALGLDRMALLGVGWGSALAAEIAIAAPERITALALEGVLCADAEMRAGLAARYVPATEIAADGSHWFRTWQMLRDAEVWWPWYASRRANLRRVAGEFDALALHRRTQETLRQPGGYAALVQAAVAQDTTERLRMAGTAVTLIAGSANPLATACDAQARQALPAAQWAPLAEWSAA